LECICNENTYWKGNLVESALIGESKTGERSHILNGLNLTVSQDGFTLTNAEGAHLRQGNKQTNVFEIYDSTPFPCDNLHLDAPGFKGTFDDYEIKYGHGRVERTKAVKFAAYAETTKTKTAIGLTRLAGGSKTKAIYAFYYDYAMSRREKAKVIADFVYTLLQPTQRASITAVGVTVDKINGPYAGIIRMYGDSYKSKHEEARILADGAAESGEGMAEVFEQAMKYETQGLFEQAEQAEATQATEQEQEVDENESIRKR